MVALHPLHELEGSSADDFRLRVGTRIRFGIADVQELEVVKQARPRLSVTRIAVYLSGVWTSVIQLLITDRLPMPVLESAA